MLRKYDSYSVIQRTAVELPFHPPLLAVYDVFPGICPQLVKLNTRILESDIRIVAVGEL